MRKILLFFTSIIFSLNLFASEEDVLESAIALKSIMSENRIPQQVLKQTKAIAILSDVYKAGFFVGGLYGNGHVVFLNNDNNIYKIKIKGGSVGLQFGLEHSRLVFFITNAKIAKDLLDYKVTLEADASIAIGFFGDKATATSDIKLNQDIYVYSDSNGVFAGISLGGSVLSISGKEYNNQSYGANKLNEIIDSIKQLKTPIQQFQHFDNTNQNVIEIK